MPVFMARKVNDQTYFLMLFGNVPLQRNTHTNTHTYAHTHAHTFIRLLCDDEMKSPNDCNQDYFIQTDWTGSVPKHDGEIVSRGWSGNWRHLHFAYTSWRIHFRVHLFEPFSTLYRVNALMTEFFLFNWTFY